MPEFHGSKNLHIGADSKVDPKTEKRTDIPAWAMSEYDANGRDYVIRLSDEDAEKFRALSEEHTYDFREVVSSSNPEADDSKE